MSSRKLFIASILLIAAVKTISFSPFKSIKISSSETLRNSIISMSNDENEGVTSKIDWDVELKRLKSKEVKGVSGVEVAAEQMKKKVDKTINKVLPIRIEVPNTKKIGRELQSKDWRFWLVVIALIAFATSFSVALNREELVVLNDFTAQSEAFKFLG
mmetsp:Transcript_4829/g.7323  ORF Transcript_4829/g.7323 Transcript_4829/m.7323 type:complete len:158 (+) Transcript_4829:49-522(+)